MCGSEWYFGYVDALVLLDECFWSNRDCRLRQVKYCELCVLGTCGSGQAQQARHGGWALPSNERPHHMRTRPEIQEAGSSRRIERPNGAYHPRGKGQI